MGAALSAEPEVLLLDEPTNHLDPEGRQWLLDALGAFRGVGLIVSHDRGVLEELTRHTLRIHHGEVRLWSGAYQAARAEWEAELEARRGAREEAQREHHKLQRRLSEERRAHAETVAACSSRHRMKSRHDHDARSVGAKFRVEQAEAAVGRRVTVARREAERAAQALGSITVDKTVGRSVFIDFQRSPQPWPFTLQAATVRAGEVELLSDVSVRVGREDRIRVEGANGAGKTTLLTALMESSAIPRERILHLPQDVSASDGARALEQARRLAPEHRGRVLSLVAALERRPESRYAASTKPASRSAKRLATTAARRTS